MSKTSDWVIIATAGTTVSDGRVISEGWINDMAELYDPEEFKALIWPEHYRSAWAVFEGKNWGEVEELKAGKFKDKLRLFAKLTPNHYLLEANKDGQKLFSSIEPEPNYQKKGRCYLLGLAVTDSPASSGTTRLRFSRIQGQHTELECSVLEEWDLSPFYNQGTEFSKFFAMCKNFFQSGASSPEQTPEPEQGDTEVTDELKALLKEYFSNLKIEIGNEIETKFSALKLQPQEPEAPEEQDPMKLFSAELTKQLKPLGDLTEKFNGLDQKFGELETKFNALSGEASGQRPPEEGAGDLTVEAL